MARINNLTNFLTDVATAIKTKKGSEVSIPATNFDTEILALPSQGVYEQRVLNISANGSQTITPSAGFDAIDELTLTVAVPEKQLQSKTYNFTQNTNIELLPDTGYDGFDSVTLNINVPGSAINNQDKTITENGVYTADSGYTGLGEVTVNVTDSEYTTNLTLSQQILGPVPYIPLEYIESTGTQYIDTGKILTQNNSVELKMRTPNDTSSDRRMSFGSRGNDLDDNNISSSSLDTSLSIDFSNSNFTVYGVAYGRIQTETEYILYASKNTRKIYNKYRHVLAENNTICNDTIITPGTCTIFKINPVPDSGLPDSSYINGKMRLYYFKIWENDGLIANLIPVKRKSDNEICLYNSITGQFFTNQGTGSFIAGPEI